MQVLLQSYLLLIDVQDGFWDVWGTVADWVAGSATFFTLLWAVIVFTRQLNDSRATQASKVIIFIGSHPSDGITVGQLLGRVENHSDLPIFYLEIGLDTQPGPLFPLTERLEARKDCPFDCFADVDIATVTFTDTAGHNWTRNNRGILRCNSTWPRRYLRRVKSRWFSWWRQPGM